MRREKQLIKGFIPFMSASEVSENSRETRSRLDCPITPPRYIWSPDHNPPRISYPLNQQGEMRIILALN